MRTWLRGLRSRDLLRRIEALAARLEADGLQHLEECLGDTDRRELRALLAAMRAHGAPDRESMFPWSVDGASIELDPADARRARCVVRTWGCTREFTLVWRGHAVHFRHGRHRTPLTRWECDRLCPPEGAGADPAALVARADVLFAAHVLLGPDPVEGERKLPLAGYLGMPLAAPEHGVEISVERCGNHADGAEGEQLCVSVVYRGLAHDVGILATTDTPSGFVVTDVGGRALGALLRERARDHVRLASEGAQSWGIEC
jgi:hypothetical protein